MSWTDERIDTLRKLWENGLTASQIADELGGVSRNAVIGKAHRLGLKSRPSPVKAGDDTPAAKAVAKPAPERIVRPAPPKRMPEAPPVVARAEPRPEAAGPRPWSIGPTMAMRPTPAMTHPVAAAAPPKPTPRRSVSIGPGGFIRQGTRRPAGADPASAAAPPRSGQTEPGHRRQDQPARSQ